MVRSRWIKTVMATLMTTGLAWGQAAPSPPAKAADDPTGRIITVAEKDKPAQKCKVVKCWTDAEGRRVLQVEALDTGEVMTIVTTGLPVMGTPPSGKPESLASRIFHWGKNRTPPPGTPMPPDCGPDCKPIATVTAPVISTAPPARIADCTPCPPKIETVPAKPPAATAKLPVIECPPDCDKTGKPRLLDKMFGRDKATPPAPVVVTEAPKPDKPKVTVIEPAKPGDWRQSWGKGDAKPSEPKNSVADATKKPAEPKKIDLPHADAKKPDPLTDPKMLPPLPAKDKPPVKPETPKTPAKTEPPKTPAPPAVAATPSAPPATLPMPGERLPMGTRSVIDSGTSQYVPVPVVTLPPMFRNGPPMPPNPQWRVPQPPRITPQLTNSPEASAPGSVAVNAFTPAELIPPYPYSAVASLYGNAFSSSYGIPPNPGAPAAMAAAGAPLPGAFGGPVMPAGAMMLAQGPRYAPMLPGNPYGPVVRLPMAPAGATAAALQPPAAPPAPAASTVPTQQQLLSTLREALYPSQREAAAEQLAACDWKTNEVVVQALVQGAKEDPAATVRAACVRSLAKMKAQTLSVVSAVQALKSDADPRVRGEAAEALAVLAPEAAGGVQPVGAVAPAPGLPSPSVPSQPAPVTTPKPAATSLPPLPGPN